MSKHAKIPPMLAELERNGGGAAIPVQQAQIVREEIVHTCNFGFAKAELPNGLSRWMLTFDIPCGPGVVNRLTIPFDGAAIEKFETGLRAWRTGVEIA